MQKSSQIVLIYWRNKARACQPSFTFVQLFYNLVIFQILWRCYIIELSIRCRLLSQREEDWQDSAHCRPVFNKHYCGGLGKTPNYDWHRALRRNTVLQFCGLQMRNLKIGHFSWGGDTMPSYIIQLNKNIMMWARCFGRVPGATFCHSLLTDPTDQPGH